MTERRRQLGQYGERLAERQYAEAGYQLVARNFRCRLGEIDLIFKKDGTFYFVEVRTKSSCRFGEAEESITARKKATIRKVSQYFLQRYQLDQVPVQFDVVAVFIDTRRKKAWLKHYPRAF